jgi:hypothetical protein
MLWFILRAGGTWKKRPNVRTRPDECKAEGRRDATRPMRGRFSPVAAALRLRIVLVLLIVI